MQGSSYGSTQVDCWWKQLDDCQVQEVALAYVAHKFQRGGQRVPHISVPFVPFSSMKQMQSKDGI